ncbi:transglycosylase SLT domain-containing protein [Mycobacterium sp. 050134]|uniref:transglycosylase SLT domain-containing protein n=1 Tax=Mycobacterium sp. 050134 TaxID=3096111 RepID=UPI002EDAB7AF
MADPLTTQALAALSRGHNLFAGGVTDDRIGDTPVKVRDRAERLGRLNSVPAAGGAVQQLHLLADNDLALAQVVAAARYNREHARAATRAVYESARADASSALDTPIGHREAMARMASRLRAQHAHIVRSQSRARILATRLRRLHYHGRRPARSGRAAIVSAIRKALDLKGIHDPEARARWERGMDLVARRESNYNADAVNGWDSNAARGTPSKGAWQFIAPTFAAYHQPGTSPNIYDLVAQACAFINYARGHYGVAADASNLAARIQQADPHRGPRGY